MTERLYWGLLVFFLLFSWFLFVSIRRFTLIRMKVKIRELIQRERVAAIAAYSTMWPPNEIPAFIAEPYDFPLLNNAAACKKLLLLSGCILAFGGAGVLLMQWCGSLAWILIGIGVGLIIFFFIDRRL